MINFKDGITRRKRKINILTVDTGNTKLDEAYKRMQVHICTYDKVDEFINYFKSITKDKKEDELLNWLLKVLFWEFKYGREANAYRENMSDWEVLLNACSDDEKNGLEAWIKTQLNKKGVYENV